MATASSSTSSALIPGDRTFYSFSHTCELLCIGRKNSYSLWRCIDHERRTWRGVFNFNIGTETARPVRMEGNFPSDLVPVRHGRRLVLHQVNYDGVEISQCEYNLKDDIICLKFNYHFMVVCMRNEFIVVERRAVMFPTADPFYKYTFNYPLWPLAVAMGTVTEPGVHIAFPWDDVLGCMRVVNIQNKRDDTSVGWRGNRPDFIAISRDGKTIAAGKHGSKYIGVVDVATGDPIHDFNTENMTISSIAFNLEFTFLAVASNANQIHIFELKETGEPEEAVRRQKSSLTGRMNRALRRKIELDYREPAFAVAKLAWGTASAIGLVTIPGGWTRLLCVNKEGVIDTFKVPQRAARSGNRRSHQQTCQLSATTTVTTKVWGAPVVRGRAPSESSDEELRASLAEAMEDIVEPRQNSSESDEQGDWVLL